MSKKKLKEENKKLKEEIKNLNKQQSRSKIIISNMKKRIGVLEVKIHKNIDARKSKQFFEEIDKLKEQLSNYDKLLVEKQNIIKESENKVEEIKKDLNEKDKIIKKKDEIVQEIEKKGKEKEENFKKIVENEKKNVDNQKKAFKKGVTALKEVNKVLVEELSDYKKRNYIINKRMKEVNILKNSNISLKSTLKLKDKKIENILKEQNEIKKFLKHENSGYIKKQGDKRKTKHWRWFIFEKDSFSYYKDSNDKKPLKTVPHSVDMEIERNPEFSNDDPLAFGLKTSTRTFVFYGSSLSEKERWILFLQEWIQKK